jgi:hypothetical protein
LLLLAKALAAADPPALPIEKMPVKVFGSPTSAEVARVLACLFEKDVEFQLIRVDSFRGPKRLPQYLKLQVLSHNSATDRAIAIAMHTNAQRRQELLRSL